MSPRYLLFLALLSGCDPRVEASVPETGCAVTTDAVVEEAAFDAMEPDTTKPSAADAAKDTREESIELSCKQHFVGEVCGEHCDLVVRLDYESKAILGYRYTCGGVSPALGVDDARRLLQGKMKTTNALPIAMVGFEHAFYAPPTTDAPARGDGGIGLDAGMIGVVDARIGAVLFAASIDRTLAGGSIVHPRSFHAFDGTTYSVGDCNVLRPASTIDADPINPPDGPLLGKYAAREAANAAWGSPLGWALETKGAPAPHAAVLRYAPTDRGTFRDLIVVIELGKLACRYDP